MLDGSSRRRLGGPGSNQGDRTHAPLSSAAMVPMGFYWDIFLLTCRLGLGWGWVGSVGDENVGGGGSGS